MSGGLDSSCSPPKTKLSPNTESTRHYMMPSLTLQDRIAVLADEDLLQAYDKHLAAHGYEGPTGFCYPEKDPIVWVKFGSDDIRTAEAENQKFAFNRLQAVTDGIRIPEVFRVLKNEWVTLIIMEYISGVTLRDLFAKEKKSPSVDYVLQTIAEGINILLSADVPPDATPGPCGGGRLMHPLFRDWEATRIYDSVGSLVAHLDAVATHRPNFTSKLQTEQKLHFCYVDFSSANFILADSGKVYIVDFEAAGFMPLSLMSYAAIKESTRLVGKKVEDYCQLPKEDLEVLIRVGYWFGMGFDVRAGQRKELASV